jgi:hypothetical protein
MTDAEKIIVGGLVIISVCLVISIMVSAVLGSIADHSNPHDEEGDK